MEKVNRVLIDKSFTYVFNPFALRRDSNSKITVSFSELVRLNERHCHVRHNVVKMFKNILQATGSVKFVLFHPTSTM